jgi:sulfur carrier protein
VMQIVVNGLAQNVPVEQSVAGLLGWLKINSDRVAVELNKSIVRKRDWERTPVPSGSQIEIVEFVGGG